MSTILCNGPLAVLVTLRQDRFGDWSYSFRFEGKTQECVDFPTQEHARDAAQWHLDLLQERAHFDGPFDSVGVIYRGRATQPSTLSTVG